MKRCRYEWWQATAGLLLVAVFLSVGCGKPVEAEQPSPANTEQKAPQDSGEKYGGAWRAKDSTVLISREGPAFVIQTEGPAGPKEVGTFENGVVRFGSQTALYTAASDRLVFDGKDYKRIDPRTQTIADLEAIAEAIGEYTRQNSYGTPPINDIDFFVGVPRVFPDMAKVDGWGTRYRYLYKFGQTHWAVVSAGPDGVFNPVMTADMVADGMIGAGGDDIAITDRGFASTIRR